MKGTYKVKNKKGTVKWVDKHSPLVVKPELSWATWVMIGDTLHNEIRRREEGEKTLQELTNSGVKFLKKAVNKIMLQNGAYLIGPCQDGTILKKI